MIGISKLYCSNIEPSDVLRYGNNSKELPSHLLQFSLAKKPVIVWNITKSCNLNCKHCYSHSNLKSVADELSTDECKEVLNDLAQFKVPVVLFSGGEPLTRNDVFELISYTKSLGLRAVVSTNGTLITKDIAREIKNLDVSYIGVSLDGNKETNDKFRGVKDAFDKAITGIQNCLALDIKVGLRFTISKYNYKEIPFIFDLIEELKIPRICFYHLVYTGRASELIDEALPFKETKETVDLIINKTKMLHKKGLKTEVLTVDNHSDGVYLYLKMKQEKHPNTENVYNLLKMNGGNNSGIGIGCISWNGDVHADQFWRHHSFGNVRNRKFSDIWLDLNDPIMKKLKNRKQFLKGRCGICKWQNICNGNFRVRAEAITGDIWAADPACYLTDTEIGIKKQEIL